ncbi:AAA family ATPase [Georhizobium profundi]
MKAYATFPRHITDQSQRQEHKSFMSLARFLRRAIIVRALRNEREFRSGQPGRFILLVPPSFEPKTMVSAARRALSKCKPDLQDLFEYDVDPVDAETSPLWLEDLPVRLMEMPRYLLLTHSLDFIPHRCRLGFDAVLQMQPPTPAHWRAALKVCLGLAATNGEIDRIARLPIDLVALATGRRRSVSEIINEVEAAIAEDDAKESRSKQPDASSRQPRLMTLQELAGYGAAKSWGLDLASDLAAWKAGALAWADVDRGVLLCGPPGTGKTTFAAALARSCDAHLVAASVARWQATGHLGDLLKAMRKDFAEARKHAPSILFIDEFDSIGDRARFSDHHASYSIQVVNGLLECIDGLDDREGVVIVGACNDSDGIDPALLRPGRLDRQIDIPLPDEEARRAILRVHQTDALADDVVEKIASVTDGWSGADLEALCRRARRRARKERRAVTLDDFMAELPQEIAVPDDLVDVMAIHEAGHAVVASALGRGVEMIEINRTIRRDHAGLGGHVTIQQQPLKRRSRASYLEEVTILMAGIAAETVFYGEHADGAGAVPGSDLQRATDLATIMETSMGFGSSLVYHDAQDAYSLDRLRRSDLKLKGRVDAILKSCLKTAKDIVSADRQAVEAIAKHLVRNGSMPGHQVKSLMERQRTSAKRCGAAQTKNVA